MAGQDKSWLDPDLAQMDLSYGEKSGLQVYRNYTKAFEKHAIAQFVEIIDREPLDLFDLERLTALIANEDARFLPVIVCAFADELLKKRYKGLLPDDLPGGKSNMFGGYGPLSDLAKRIQLAFAFDVLSPDLLLELDRLRRTRNKISHSWNLDDVEEFFTKSPITDMHRIEELLHKEEGLEHEFGGKLEPLLAFRIRLIWLSGRLVYETAAYNRAKSSRSRPVEVLYGKPTPKWLSSISAICFEATRNVTSPLA